MALTSLGELETAPGASEREQAAILRDQAKTEREVAGLSREIACNYNEQAVRSKALWKVARKFPGEARQGPGRYLIDSDVANYQASTQIKRAEEYAVQAKEHERQARRLVFKGAVKSVAAKIGIRF